MSDDVEQRRLALPDLLDADTLDEQNMSSTFTKWLDDDRPEYCCVRLRDDGSRSNKKANSQPIGTLDDAEALLNEAFKQMNGYRDTAVDDARDESAAQYVHFDSDHQAARKRRLNWGDRRALMRANNDGDRRSVVEPAAIQEDRWKESDEVAADRLHVRSVRTLQFGLLSPDEIRRISVVEVTKPALFDHNVPVEGGLYDTRMGSAMRQFRCTTCSQKFKDCPGHFGRIELATKVYHPNFLDVVAKVLNTICIDCSTLLVPKTKRFVERQSRCRRSQDRLRFAHDRVKSKTTNKQCCGTPADSRFRMPFEKMITGVALGSRRCRLDSVLNAQSSEIRSMEHGCGHYQPKIVREGIKLIAKYPQLPASVRNPRRKSSKIGDPPTPKKRKGNSAPSSSEEQRKGEGEEEGEEETRVVKEKEFEKARRERAETQRVLSADETHTILSRLSDEDCWLLGFDPQFGHPSWMILSVLPVPPPAIRPPVITPFGKKPITHDHLTIGLVEIVKENNKLRRQMENNISTFQENFKIIVQYHVATYIDNDTKGLPKAIIGQAADKVRASIAERFKGKTGRLRGNMMGKRVDFSSRTVITPDANISLNEVGVPKWCAERLTVPERVSRYNVERLQRSVILGPTALTGAKFVHDEHGRMFDLRFLKDIELKYGYVVERHLRDGDIVAFNRQPSLHKFSIMAHRVRIMDGYTFRLNLSVTGPYNADFDGDEMNMHVPQSLAAVAELMVLMETGRCIVTPLNNKPIMGLCQDSLLGTRLITQRNVFLERGDVMQLMMHASVSCESMYLPQPAILRPHPLWTGKQVVSMMLPDTLQLGPSGNRFRPESESAGDVMTASDCRVLVRRGELLSGILDKKFVGATNGSIVHILNNDYGHNEARIFMEEMQGVVQHFVTEMRGMSIGIEDCTVRPEIKRAVRAEIEATKRDVKELVRCYKRGKIEPMPNMSVHETFEAKMSEILNRARDKAGRKVSDALDVNVNNLKLMATAGSKGGDVNIAQIMSFVGQQNQNGGRIPEMFRDRGMPHARKYDFEDVASRGFVANSYMDGLTPTEMFMHAVGGREGLTDTALKTSTIGYIQRRLVKAGEDISVVHDHTVRNSIGRIVQFCYGDDDMDGACFEWQKVSLLGMSNDQVLGAFGTAKDIPLSETVLLLRNEANLMLRLRDTLRKAVYPSTETRWPLPGNVCRLIGRALLEHPSTNDHDLVTVEQCVTQLNAFNDALMRRIDPILYNRERTMQSVFFYAAFVRSTLSPRVAREKHRLSSAALRYVLDALLRRHNGWQIVAGEGVGVLAAQAIGEPATQMTLNTFHFAGDGNKYVTHGVPRLEELIKAGGSMKTPSMSLHLKYDIERVHERKRTSEQRDSLARQARLLAGKLTHVAVRDVVLSTEVMYEPTECLPSGARQRETVERWTALCSSAERRSRINQFGPLLDWVLLLHLSRTKMFERGITPSVVGKTLLRHYDGSVDVVYSNDNDCDREENDNGGFVRIRMHAYEVVDALRSELDPLHHQLLSDIEQKIEGAYMCDGPISVDSRSAGLDPNLRLRESAFGGLGHSTVDDSVSTTDDGRFKKPKISAAMAARIKQRIKQRDKQRRDSNVDSECTQSTSPQQTSAIERTTRKETKKETPRPTSMNRSNGGGEGGEAARATETATVAVETEAEMRTVIWGNLNASTCFPMIMRHLGSDCLSIALTGVKGVGDVMVREVNRTVYHSESGALIGGAKEWVLETSGSNLRSSFAMQGIDHRRTRSNNPAQVAKVLGIEAARRCLFDELRAVLQFDGAYVNYRHINLLCDIMTQSGALMAVNRHGLNRRQTGPLMRATLEQSVPMLTNAGCFSEFDPLTGPSERVATGRAFSHGTGTHIDVILDTTKLINAKRPPLVPLAKRPHRLLHCTAGARGAVMETSPFAPTYDRNQSFMIEDIKNFVSQEQCRKKARLKEHEEVICVLNSGVAREKEVLPCANPFQRPKPTRVEDASNVVVTNSEPPSSTIVNPFSRDNVIVRTDSNDDCNSGSEPVSKRQRSLPSVSSHLDDEKRVKFSNPFSRKQAEKNADSGNASLTKLTALSSNFFSGSKSRITLRPYYVPSSPRQR